MINFYTQCEKKGIYLLPDDKKFIKEQLSKLHYNDIQSALRRYIEIWHEAMSSSQSLNQHMSIGRKTANLWLLKKAKGLL